MKWLIDYANSGKRFFFIYCVIGMMMVVVWIVLPILVARQTLLLTDNSFNSLYKMAFIIFFLQFFYSFLKFFISYTAQRFFVMTYKNLHVDISKKFLNIKISDIKSKSTGYYLQRLSNDTIDISDFLLNITDDAIDILINIGSLITIFILNKYIFLLYLYFLILLYIIKKTKTDRYIYEEKNKREKIEDLMSTNIELINGAVEIKLLGIKNNFLKNIKTKLEKFGVATIRLGSVNRFFLFLHNNVINVFRLLLVSLCIYMIKLNYISVSVALISINYQDDIFSFLDYMESFIKNIKIFNLSSYRIKEIDSLEKELYGNYKGKNFHTCEFNNVSFSYIKDTNIINNLNMKITENGVYSIVGISGSGKSTVFNLLTRMYDYSNGKILINGVAIEDYSEKSLRNLVTIVTQTPYLFKMSIMDNLKLVNLNVTDKEIIKACKIAQIHDDIQKLPEKYDTILLDGGMNLSGGQRQRLAIARALLKDTPLILLDEATSALDNNVQLELQLAISKLRKNKTIVLIAHRLSTVIDSDKIFVLDKGKFIAEGSHYQLLKSCKLYQNLYRQEGNKKLSN